MYWEQVLNLRNDISQLTSVIVSVSFCGLDEMEFYQCDLLLTSADINRCNFRRQLGTSLLKDNCIIYVEVSKLTVRGETRLLGLLRDLKRLFSKRVLLVLFSSNLVPRNVGDLSQLSLDFKSYMRTPSKGYSTISVTDIAESVKRRKLFQDRCSAKVNDNIPDTLQLQHKHDENMNYICLLYTSPSPRDS